MTIFQRLSYIGAWFGILMAGCLLIVLGYWLLYPYQPLQLNNNYLSTDKLVYREGDKLFYEFDYCKTIDKSVLVHKSFVDSVIYNTPDIRGNFDAGCKKTNIAVDVPKLPEGEYMLRVEYIYQVNPLREVTVTAYTNKFMVVK